jgi:hypothetical protein
MPFYGRRSCHESSSDDYQWLLFDLANDFSEANDPADTDPAKLRQLTDLLWHEAGRNEVNLLDDTCFSTRGGGVSYPSWLGMWKPR